MNLLRRRRVLSAGLVVLLAAVASAYLVDRVTPKPKEPDVLVWLESYAPWWRPLARAWDRERFEAFRGCSKSFRRVAPPPAELVEETRAVVAACRALEARPASFLARSDWLFASDDLLSALPSGRPLPTRGGRFRASRIDPRLSEIASSLVGGNVEGRCWSRQDWQRVRREASILSAIPPAELGGFAELGGIRFHLGPEFCAVLARFVYLGYRPTNENDQIELADAVNLFAHEVRHLSEGADEAFVECYALQDVRTIASRIAGDEKYAGRLALLAWELRFPNLPLHYQSIKCHNGGPWDRRPRSDVWP